MSKLKISPTLSLPIDFVTQTQAILAKKGKGKTYKASVEAEEMLAAGQQIVVIDPTGAWWGLRSSADGKSAGYPISIFGGEHADVELLPTAGEVIADAIATEHFSAVIDLTLFRKGETLRFMAAFLETLYRKNRQALHLFIDEADFVAPQRPFGPDEARVLGACEDIVRRGRIRGIGCTLISQRAQVINKNVLSQIDMLTCLGMNHPKDIGAVEEWVAVHGDEKQAERMIEQLPALPQSEAWVWHPAADIFKRITFRDRTTFDSSKTPKAGERKIVPKVLAPVDIKRLGETIAATVEQQKASDPKALKARIVELERQLAAKPVATKTVNKPVIDKKSLDALLKGIHAMNIGINQLAQAQQTVVSEADNLRKFAAQLQKPEIHVERHANGGSTLWVPAPRPIGTSDINGKPVPRSQAGELPVGERATLSALIQWPKGLNRSQLTVLTGYKRSTRDAYIARLREKGFVETNLVYVYATDAGRAAIPDAQPLPTGRALQAHWMDRLPAGEGAIFHLLITAGGAPVSKDELTEKTGYKRSTRDAYLARLSAKELIVDGSGRGTVAASPTLFE